MLTIPADILRAILAHARAEHPTMACGLVAGPSESDRPERYATDPDVHYLAVSTFAPDHEEYRSYLVRDGVAIPEEIVVAGGAPGSQRPPRLTTPSPSQHSRTWSRSTSWWHRSRNGR